MIAALYIDVQRGPYAGLDGVDCWGVDRDARLYRGPHPVIAHPPCAAWGNFREMRQRDEWDSTRLDRDAVEFACGPIAVRQVRRFGGVLEHPAGSGLFRFMRLPRPGARSDEYGGRTIEVDQGAYGHPCPKRTWLYVVGVDVGWSEIRPATDPGGRVEHQSRNVRHLTPPDFAAWLVSIARRCRQQVAA